MAQTGYTPIQLYRTATASAAPTSGNLADGELAINTNDGKLFYKDSGGTVQVIATKNAAAGSFTSISDSGNLTFTGTGNRITGDFSNATLASRVMFQTSTTNGNTSIEAIPNGTATVATLVASSSATDPANTSTILMSVNGTSAVTSIQSGIRGTGTYLPLTFYTGGSERMRLDTSGNLGIGTSSPGVKLDVSGIMRSSTWSLSGTGITGGVSAFSAGTVSTDSNWGMYFRAPTGSSASAEYSFRNASDVERLRIDTSGNVGIGTSTPGTKLEVNGQRIRVSNATDPGLELSNTTTVKGYVFYDTTNDVVVTRHASTSTGVAVNSSGNVGIGTASATSKLTVAGNVSVQDGAGYGWAGLTSYVGGSSASNFINFTTNSSERMRIDSSGNVGIGTSSPSYKLSVSATDGIVANIAGTTKAVRFVTNSSQASVQAVDNTGSLSYQPLFLTGSIVQLGASGSENARIDTSGNLQVGGTTVANTVGYVNSRTNTRAWARWTGSTVAIASSYNVSSITRSSAGQYVVNFTTALADANYAPMMSCSGDVVYNGYGILTGLTSAPTTSNFAMWTKAYNGTAADANVVQIAVFGN
jgi:hypothetical protein